MNIYFDELKKHIAKLKFTCDSKDHEEGNKKFAEEVRLFLNHWKADWCLVYLHMNLPVAPFVFAFLAKPSKEIDRLKQYFSNWSMSPENYYYQDSLEPSLDFRYANTFSGYEPLIFLRSHPEKLVIEISQKFTQCNNLFLNESGHYCRQNANGEFEDLLFVLKEEKFAAVLMHKKILEPYIIGTKKCLIRMFDVMSGVIPHCRENHRFEYSFASKDNCFFASNTRLIFDDNNIMQYCRGGEIIKHSISKKEAKCFAFNQSEEKDQEFWTRNRLTNGSELKSCKINDQHYLDPVFFNPEVLSKYTAYPSKYTLEEGKLFCKTAGWMLRSCYKSSDNQVYCYLGDLSLLPPSEQMHWKSYNLQLAVGQESLFAMRRDFNAEWIEEKYGKNHLERILKHFPSIIVNENSVMIWSAKENLESMIHALYVPVIEEHEQYRNYVGALARLTTEGFKKLELEKWAKHYNLNVANDAGSLTILEQCLSALIDKASVEEIIKPLKKLNKIKSSITSHGGGTKLSKNSIIAHSHSLITEVTKAIEKLINIISIKFHTPV